MNYTDADYAAAKETWNDRITRAALPHVPDFRAATIDTDMFTPRTIRKFTDKPLQPEHLDRIERQLARLQRFFGETFKLPHSRRDEGSREFLGTDLQKSVFRRE